MNILALEASAWFDTWLRAQPMWLLWLLCPISIAALVFGADKTVTSAVRLARSLGMSTVIIGATVVSLGTTTPEMFASVTAAFKGNSGLALGNGVGSIICDTGLIFGLCCLITRLPLDRFVLNRHGWLQLGAGLLLAGLCAVVAVLAGGIGQVGESNQHTWNRIPRWVGSLLVALLVGYMFLSVHWARRRPELAEEAVKEASAAGGRASTAWAMVVLAGGLTVVAVGSNVLIPTVSEMAQRYRVPEDFLAITLVAFGTSLPELVTALAAVAKGHKELMVGNIVGADILNVLFVVGLSACATELKIPPTFYYLHFPVMVLVLVLLRLYIFTSGGSFRRWQGAPLVGIYVVYVAALLALAPEVAGR